MNIIEALDVVYDFFSKKILEQLKREGLYDPILSGKISEGSEIYDYLSEKHSSLQDTDYTVLAEEMSQCMKKGSVLQIGCGRGDLLLRFFDLGFSPICGVDRSDAMLLGAKKKFGDRKGYFFNARIEDFDFSIVGKVDNVVINNFWGMISEEKSAQLLRELKICLTPDSVVIIGSRRFQERPPERVVAERVLREKLGFVFSHPFFDDFEGCGYDSSIISLAGASYYLLKTKNENINC